MNSHSTSTQSNFKRWSLLVGSALAVGVVLGRIGTWLIY